MLKKIGIIFLSMLFIACAAKGESAMLEEIYSMGNPKGFEKIHVENIVEKYIPLGISKEAVIEKLKEVGFKKIIPLPDSGSKFAVRHNKGKPLFENNARSIVIYFEFSDDLKLNNIEAVLIKSQ